MFPLQKILVNCVEEAEEEFRFASIQHGLMEKVKTMDRTLMNFVQRTLRNTINAKHTLETRNCRFCIQLLK